MPQDRPQITLKLAQTLDGRIATAIGHSRWVSSPESRVFAHRLRTEHDAILVGIGTVLADDPQLDARLWPGPSPIPVVLDSLGRTPLTARVLASGFIHPIIAVSGAVRDGVLQALRERGARPLSLATGERGIDLMSLLSELHAAGIRTVLVEGGAGIATSFLRARLVDRIVIIIAPKILGAGIDAIGSLDAIHMDNAIVLNDLSVDRSGIDIVVTGKPVWPEIPTDTASPETGSNLLHHPPDRGG